MGMDVIAYTASPRKTPESKHDNGYIVPGTGDPDGSIPSAWYSGTSKEDVHEFLKQEIDLLVVSVPLTKATTHLLSTEEFELLHKSNSKKGTYVANIARGQIIDQKALITALEKEQISGAALDVTDPEPLPEDDPLWDAPNILITPHCSGSTDRYADRAFEVLIENIKRERSGGNLINEVNREKGY
jgi:phosphoglycerate dehydrogenase-like enzyme